jgi:hypothetical protein
LDASGESAAAKSKGQSARGEEIATPRQLQRWRFGPFIYGERRTNEGWRYLLRHDKWTQGLSAVRPSVSVSISPREFNFAEELRQLFRLIKQDG